MLEEGIKTDIYFWDSNCEKQERKNCVLLKEFMYARCNFFLLEKMMYYHICCSNDGELISVWYHDVNDDDGNRLSASEVMSLFRKGFQDNEITQDKITMFLNEPAKFKKKYIKCKSKKDKPKKILMHLQKTKTA